MHDSECLSALHTRGFYKIHQLLAEQNKDICFGVIRDFNSIKFGNERVGRSRSVDTRDMEKFNEMIDFNSLEDISLVGSKFTMKSGRRSISDHRPIFTETIKIGGRNHSISLIGG
ncbi:hypothetical protein ACS0TY_026827 [Phlomoides rotata]